MAGRQVKILIYQNISIQDEHYGGCCGGSCGGYVGGKSAMEHAAEGLFDQAPYVEWTRGLNSIN